jgi:hypothetical protein
MRSSSAPWRGLPAWLEQREKRSGRLDCGEQRGPYTKQWVLQETPTSSPRLTLEYQLCARLSWAGARRPQPPRGRGGGLGRPRHVQPPDSPRAIPLRAHDRAPRLEDPAQARARLKGRDRCLGNTTKAVCPQLLLGGSTLPKRSWLPVGFSQTLPPNRENRWNHLRPGASY